MKNAIRFKNVYTDNGLGRMLRLIPTLNVWWDPEDRTVCVTLGWLAWDVNFWFNVSEYFM